MYVQMYLPFSKRNDRPSKVCRKITLNLSNTGCSRMVNSSCTISCTPSVMLDRTNIMWYGNRVKSSFYTLCLLYSEAFVGFKYLFSVQFDMHMLSHCSKNNRFFKLYDTHNDIMIILFMLFVFVSVSMLIFTWAIYFFSATVTDSVLFSFLIFFYFWA